MIDWTAWDVHINDPAYRWRTGSNPDTAFGTMVQALSANGIIPVLNLRNRDENGWPAWAPNPPTTDEDLNEWWQYCFAVAYWFNVRNNYGVTHWQVHNEPDLSSQGWGGTEAQYAQLVSYAYDAVKTANDLAGIDTVMIAPVESQMPFPRTYTYIDDLFSAADTYIELADVHWYHMNGSYPLSDLEAAIDDVRAQVTTYNPDGTVEPLWISEYGNFSSSSAYDNLPEAMRTARQLVIFTRKGVQGVHIFSFYDWGTVPGLVRAGGTRTETYYAYRLMIRGLAGGKEQLGTTIGGAGANSYVVATRDETNVYVTVLQDDVGTPADVAVDLSDLGTGSATAVVYEYSAANKDRAVYTPTVAAGVFTFTAPANGVSLAVVPRLPDLSIAQAVTPTVADPGRSITYTLLFSNAGDATARGVVITDAVPLSVTVTGVISSGVVITDGGTTPGYVWQVQDLAPGEGGAITITALLSAQMAGGTISTNTASIATTSTDSDTTNNSTAAPVTASDTARCGLLAGETYAFNQTSIPIAISITRPGDLVCIRVVRTDGDHPNAATPQQTGRYWTISPTLSGSSGFSLTLTLPHTETATTTDEVCRYTGAGTTWDCAAYGWGGVNISRTWVMTLSDWTTGDGSNPTAVTLSSFRATPAGDGVLVAWETALELSPHTYYVLRGEQEPGPYRRISPPISHPHDVFGGRYGYLDRGVTPGESYFYELEAIAVDGRVEFHGPVVVVLPTGGSGHRVYLPIVIEVR